jgi:hypothetical protein
MRLLREQVRGATILLILEPASQTFASAAMDLRDELTTLGYQPLYPCPSAAACPMRPLSRDWCYSEGLWQQPKIMQTLDKSIGINRQYLSGALLAFASPSVATALRPAAAPAVIVGRPERAGLRLAAGKRSTAPSAPTAFDYLLCTGEALRKAAPAEAEAPLPRGLTYEEAPRN